MAREAEYVVYLKGFRTLSQDVEEGICQVLAHIWLESQLSNGASSSSSSASRASKRVARSKFEKKLGEFFKHQIESDASPVYGDGFRAGRQAVQKYGLQTTLDHIRMTGSLFFSVSNWLSLRTWSPKRPRPGVRMEPTSSDIVEFWFCELVPLSSLFTWVWPSFTYIQFGVNCCWT